MAEIQLSDLGATSVLSREIAWLELALSFNSPDPRKRFILVEEVFGEKLMVATDKQRLHIATQYAHIYPDGWLPRGDEYPPGNTCFAYESVLEDCTGTRITVSRELLEMHLNSLMNLMAKNTDTKVLTVEFTQTKICLSINSLVKGKVVRELPCYSDGKPEKMRLNLSHMIDALNGSEGDMIVLQQSVERNKGKFIAMKMEQGRTAYLASGW